MTVKEIREKTGLTRAAFARKYGIPYRTIECWEHGNYLPSDYAVNLLKIAVENENRGLLSHEKTEKLIEIRRILDEIL